MSGISAGEFPRRFLRDDGKRTATANERVVMTLLSRGGPASRADLARLTGLAPHSITRLVEPLLVRGLLAESAPLAAGRGKPSAKLRLVAGAAFGVGLSVMTDAVLLSCWIWRAGSASPTPPGSTASRSTRRPGRSRR